jgi:hypothetical protein
VEAEAKRITLVASEKSLKEVNEKLQELDKLKSQVLGKKFPNLIPE